MLPAFVIDSGWVDDIARHSGSKKLSIIVTGAGAPSVADTSAHSVGVCVGAASGSRSPSGRSQAVRSAGSRNTVSTTLS